MNKVIIWTNPESGNVCVCYPTGELPIEEVRAKDAPEGAAIVDPSHLPEHDADFFDAWRIQPDGSVAADVEAVKAIHADRLRAARAPKLAEWDVRFQRALEEGTDTTPVVEAKQALRDITADPGLTGATSVAEVRAFWPDILK